MEEKLAWPLKKWLIQYCISLPSFMVLFAFVQYLKGRPIDYSIKFGILWGAITVAIFAATRVYYFKKSVYCSVCNDTPQFNNQKDE